MDDKQELLLREARAAVWNSGDHSGPEPTKVCSKCRLTLPLSDFHYMNASLDGRQNQCKVCKGGDGSWQPWGLIGFPAALALLMIHQAGLPRFMLGVAICAGLFFVFRHLMRSAPDVDHNRE